MTNLFKPATKRKFLYHITNIKNLESIKKNGLLPQKKKSKFGIMTPGLTKEKHKPILFLLPIFGIHAYGMKGFLSEWWHGDILDIVFLRIPFETIKSPMESTDKYYAKQEVWTFDKIDSKHISVLRRLESPYKWKKIHDFK